MFCMNLHNYYIIIRNMQKTASFEKSYKRLYELAHKNFPETLLKKGIGLGQKIF